jgi:hypothetical protein
MWLLGEPINLDGKQLPNYRDILRSVYKFSQDLSINGSVEKTVDICLEIWTKIGLETARKENVIKKVHILLSKYRLMKKNENRGSTIKSQIFAESLDKLFDIEKHDFIPKSETLIKFLNDQKTQRIWTIAELNRSLYFDEPVVDEHNEAAVENTETESGKELNQRSM